MGYKCIDAFCWAGWLSMWLDRSWFELEWSFDNDERSIETMEHNNKNAEHKVLVSSIQDFNMKLENWDIKLSGKIDLLAWWPPCQGFSIQRIWNDKDIRNELVLEYLSLISRIKPRFFLMENVPWLIWKRWAWVLKKFLRKIEELWYFIHVQVLNAQDYGVPQRRKRLFIIWEQNELGWPFFEFPAPINNWKTVRDAIGSLPSPDEWNWIPNHKADKLSELNIKRLMTLKEGEWRDSLPVELLADCHRSPSSKIWHRNVYWRMKWDDVAPTITARFDSFTRGMFGHPSEVRSISLREGASLQTFPLDYEFKWSKVEVARQIWNAVPPKLAEAVGKEIIKALIKADEIRNRRP